MVLCRLLRNRVSAQQARERKKSYVQNLEQKARDQEQSLTEMEQRIIKLERENVMLRSVREARLLWRCVTLLVGQRGSTS